MKYFSTNHQSAPVDFREASVLGQAPDKGLFFPESIPQLPANFIGRLSDMSREEIAFQVIRPYVGDTIPEEKLFEIAKETVAFDYPLVKVNDTISSLELFHGPTLAFKDVGARFMSRCLGYFSREKKGEIIVLVATSGDTGGAVANGFYGVDGVKVVIVYPSGKVSSVQEQQLTTLGKNIHAIELNGSFDDCQQLVKQAFADNHLKESVFLTSANSINVARWLPQQFYYFFAAQQWDHEAPAPVISVPSGNFGNICAGLLAFRSGLPVSHFVAACNANDVVPEYFRTGTFQAKPAVPTISNAMDVGNPSNFVRILQMFEEDIQQLRELISSYTISDEETKKVMKEVDSRFNYLTDPHGAVAYLALEKYLETKPELKGYFLETAHPVKFYDVIEPVIGRKVPVPEAVRELEGKEMVKTSMDAEYESLKDFILSLK